jgi:hypothetical protein
MPVSTAATTMPPFRIDTIYHAGEHRSDDYARL